MNELTAKQLILLLPIDKRKELLNNLKNACNDIMHCGDIVEAEWTYKNYIKLMEDNIKE